MEKNNLLWDALKAHIGHEVSIVAYGDAKNPADVCLECEDCGSVILDAELYTLIEREEVSDINMWGEYPTPEVVARLRAEYPEGTRIRLLKMDDSYHCPKIGTFGTVTGVDDIGTIHCQWDDGSCLGVAWDRDKCEKISVVEEGILKDFRNGSQTAFGEPQAWISCENGNSIEVCLEMEGLDPWEYYYSIQLHCSEEAFEQMLESGEYEFYNNGVLDIQTTKEAHLKEAIAIAEEMWNNNKKEDSENEESTRHKC